MNLVATTRSGPQLALVLAALLTTPPYAQGQRPAAEEIARSVDSLAARVVSSGVSPALGVAVVMDGRKIFQKAYGMADATRRIPATDRTLWYLASTSKSYTGFGIALLVTGEAKGPRGEPRLTLETPISELLPGIEWPAGVDPTQLTLARFLSHTHYINDNAVVQSAAFTGAIPEREWPSLIRFAQPSGNTDLVYSNFGYNVAAMVIDRLRPEGWRRFLEQAVYRPAGLRETYTRVSEIDERRIAKPHGFAPGGGFVTRAFEKTDATMNSAGGHLATLNDLTRWMIVHMDSGRIEGRQVFPAEVVALSHRLIAKHTVQNSRRFAFFEREGWAMGWDIGSYMGEPMVSRFGGYSTIRSHVSMLPGRRIGVTTQVNGPGASLATDIVAALVYDLEAGRPDARDRASARLDSMVAQLAGGRRAAVASDSTRRARQRPLSRPLAQFAGTYVNEAYGLVKFSLAGEQLRFRWGVLEGPAEVLNAEQNALRIEVAGSGQPVVFRFSSAPGPAESISLGGIDFRRQ
jgi:CubicO group peptidase (beta-lactamase class C family)